jgi:hypothetical protein
LDTIYDSGLAFDGVTVAGVPLNSPAAPEPSTWAMMILGFLGIALLGLGRAKLQCRTLAA